MTQTQQPEALRLVEWIESDMSCDGDADIVAELLRQHARIEELETKEVHTDSEQRNAIAKLLGLGDANFAWSYLHGQIKDLVKCEKELIALRKQAAPLVPQGWKLVAWVTADTVDGQTVNGKTRRIWWENNEGVGIPIYAATQPAAQGEKE